MLGSPRRPVGGFVDDSGSAWGKAQGDGPSNAAVWLQKQLRAWDKGPRIARVRMVEEFVAENRGIFAVDLEKKYGNGASLFCLRLSAWLRLSAIAQQPTALPLRALSVFLYSAQGSRFAMEVIDTGGLQPVFDILSNEYGREEERLEALLFLRGLTLHGQTIKEYLSREGAIGLAGLLLSSNMAEEILELAASLLLDLGTANPVFFPEVYAALLAALTECQRTASQLLAGHTFRMLVAPAINKPSGLNVLLREVGGVPFPSLNAATSGDTVVSQSGEGPPFRGSSTLTKVMQPKAVDTQQQPEAATHPVGQSTSKNSASPLMVAPTQDSTSPLQNRRGSAALPPLRVNRDSDNSLWKLSRTGHTPTRTPFNSPQAAGVPQGNAFDGSALVGLKKLTLGEDDLDSHAGKFQDSHVMLREGVLCGMRLLQNSNSKVQFEAFEILRTLGSIGTHGMSIVMDAVFSCLVEGAAIEEHMAPELMSAGTTPSVTPLGYDMEEESDKDLASLSGRHKPESVSSHKTKEKVTFKSPGSALRSFIAEEEFERGDDQAQALQQAVLGGGGEQQLDGNSPRHEDGMQHPHKTVEDERLVEMLEENNGSRVNTLAGNNPQQKKQMIVDENGQESFDDVASVYTIRGNPITMIDISPKKVSYISCSPRRSPSRQRPCVVAKPVCSAPVESALEKAISRELSIRNLWSRGNFRKRAELLSQANQLLESEDGKSVFEPPQWKGPGPEKHTASGHEQISARCGDEESSFKDAVSHQDEFLSEDCTDLQKLAAVKFLGIYVERSAEIELAAASLVEAGLVRALLVCLKLAVTNHQSAAPSCSTSNPEKDECRDSGGHRLVAAVMRTLQYLLSVSDLVRDFVRHVAGEEVLTWLCEKGERRFDSYEGVLAMLDHMV